MQHHQVVVGDLVIPVVEVEVVVASLLFVLVTVAAVAVSVVDVTKVACCTIRLHHCRRI